MLASRFLFGDGIEFSMRTAVKKTKRKREDE
jgi:hypothetical protein